MNSSDMSMFFMIATMYVIMIIIGIAVYLFDAIVTTIYAKNHGVRNYGLAFLPIGKEYVMGTLAEQYRPDKKIRRTLMGLAISIYSIPVLSIIFSVISYTCAVNFESMGGINSQGAGTATGVVGGFAIAVFYIVFLVLAITYTVYNFISAYYIFCYKDGEDGVIWLIIDILVSNLAMPIFMLVKMRKKGNPKGIYKPVV